MADALNVTDPITENNELRARIRELETRLEEAQEGSARIRREREHLLTVVNVDRDLPRLQEHLAVLERMVSHVRSAINIGSILRRQGQDQEAQEGRRLSHAADARGNDRARARHRGAGVGDLAQ